MCRQLLKIILIGVFMVLLLLYRTVSIAEEEKTDANGQWLYVLQDGIAVIAGCVVEPTGDLVIPSEVDGHWVAMIGNGAFMNCEGLISVIIPDSVDGIDDKAFMDCYNLTSVTIPSSVAFIGLNAFEGFDDLVLTVVEGSYAEDYAQFSGIPYILAEVVQDKKEESAANELWKYVVEDGGAIVTGCVEKPFGDLVIPGVLDGYVVTGIGRVAFDECSGLTSVSIPDGVTSIGICAFGGCDNMTSVDIPDSVTSIGGGAFSGCSSLTNVILPKSLDTVGDFPLFGSCTALTRIDVATGNQNYASIDGILFDERHKMLVAYPMGLNDTAYKIPQGTLSIGKRAFYGCIYLTGVDIPNSVTSIGDDAFKYCSGLTAVVIPDSVTSIGAMAFLDCENLSDVTIPNSVTSIGENAFMLDWALTLSVMKDSYAERYAEKNKIPYVLIN